MELLSAFGTWIAANEALLSGMVSLVVLAGFALSPFGRGLRKLISREGARASIAQDTVRVSEPESSQPHSAEPLLAVLAFDNMSSDEEMTFFSDGVSDEIIQRLSRGARMQVIARTSSFQFRAERKAEAAASLACTHLLDGSIRRSADRVRITAHLVDVASQTTIWSDRFDAALQDTLALQDQIAGEIAAAMDRTFASFSTLAVDPEAYDLYLQALPASYAPDELRAAIDLLGQVISRAPEFSEAWGRLAFLRAWLNFYEPYSGRPQTAARINMEAHRAQTQDAENAYALTARLFAVPPFAHFIEGDTIIQQLRRSPAADAVRGYIGWYLRTTGHISQSLDEAEKAYQLDALDPMTGNLLALARLAAGQLVDAVPLFEDLVERMPNMSFPIANLMRVYAFQANWDGVDRLLKLAEERELRELEAGLPFIRTKRHPSEHTIGEWAREFDASVAKTGCVDVAQLVYTAHLGLIDQAYEAALNAWLGPNGSDGDILGPDGYRTSLLFQANMPELRDDKRFPALCARLGLVEFWTSTGKWPDCAEQVPYDFKAECERHRHTAKEEFRPRTATAARPAPAN